MRPTLSLWPSKSVLTETESFRTGAGPSANWRNTSSYLSFRDGSGVIERLRLGRLGIVDALLPASDPKSL